MQEELEDRGFAIIPSVYSYEEVQKILDYTNEAVRNWLGEKPANPVHAIRSVLTKSTSLRKSIFTDTLSEILSRIVSEPVCVKSIYFNKPVGANWGVYWHQDRTINLNHRQEAEGFVNWTTKEEIHSVQPPVSILGSTLTVRIHLDDTNDQNGALRVLPSSHNAGYFKDSEIQGLLESLIPFTCNVPCGGIMLMKPLLVHSSQKSLQQTKRRVLHLEFVSAALYRALAWAEYHTADAKQLNRV